MSKDRLMAAMLDLDIRQTLDGRPFLYFPFMSISDIHWGTKGARAKRLARWLEHTETSHLQLPGDIIGGTEQSEKETWHFGGPWHRQGMGSVLRKAENGTKVIFNPGNHDYHADRLNGKNLFGILIEKETIYVDPKGRSGIIEHGHRFDQNVFKTLESQGFWYRIGDQILMKSQDFDAWVERKIPSLTEHFCSAALLKKSFKIPFNLITGIERSISRSLDKSSHQFSISGHSHVGELKRTRHGKLQMNDGSCTEDVQALVHDAKGDWALLTIHRHGMTVEMEPDAKRNILGQTKSEKYYVRWESLGLKDVMRGNPTSFDDIHTDRADRLLRLVCRAFPAEDRVALKREIRSKEKLSIEFKNALAEGCGWTSPEFQEERQRYLELQKLREKYLRLPATDPRWRNSRPAVENEAVEPVNLELKYG